VLTVHDLIPLTHPQHCDASMIEPCRRQLPPAVRAADAIIAVSHYTKAELVQHLGVPAERVRVVHHGVDACFQPTSPAGVALLRERLRLQRPYVFALGTGDPRKNLRRLVDAFARCRERGLKDVELVLAGKPWVATHALREQLAALDLEGSARVLEYVDPLDLPALYAGAELFAFPSLAEGFGMPVLEAMACGTPVLAALSSSLPEVAGDAALLVEPTDVDALAQGMARALEDSALRARLIERGLQRAGGFRWERAARETVAVYEAVA
jgi:glycosyltransferase involved in cell wall biosynthesis